MPRPTLDTLLERVHRHYPRGVESDDQAHHETEESRRLLCVQEAAAQSCGWTHSEVPDGRQALADGAPADVSIDPEVESVVVALSGWRSLAERWNDEVPGVLLTDQSNPWHDASYRYCALRPGYVLPQDRPPEQRGKPDIETPGGWQDPVVLSLSILAPVYVIYTYVAGPAPSTNDAMDADMEFCHRDFDERYRDRVAALESLVQGIFGFHRLDEATLLTPVPGITPFGSNKPLGETTLRDCLFTPHP